jgi:hypothetical protein
MNDNPYAPPAAPVSDVEPAGSLERPRVVVLAVRILWASLVMVIPGAIYGMMVPQGSVPQALLIVFSIIGLGISFAISFWLYTASWNGRGYARWVLAVLNILSFAFVAWALATMPAALKTPWPFQVINVLSNILSVGGNAMLFAPSANTWFREMKRRR